MKKSNQSNAKKYIYNDYLKNISSRYKALLGDIRTNYNFDLGTEFELVICEILQKVLPIKYGVCRGFLVPKKGEPVGDDIIIYDRHRFPHIRLMGDNDLAHKQQIPIEAAYAYIEAKNSIIIEGKGNNFKKALTQVSNAKKIVSERESVGVQNAFNPYVSIDNNHISGRKNWPGHLNPFFTAIMAPRVKNSKGEISDPKKISKELSGKYDDQFSPDLVVAGMNVCYLPHIKSDSGDLIYHSPFYIEKEKEKEKSTLLPHIVEEHSFAIGICSLLYALDTICLDIMPWPSLISDAIGIDLYTTKTSL